MVLVDEMNCKVCGNTSAKNTSVSFFRFPKENLKCRDWADRCDLLGLFQKHGTVRFHKSFRICSQHFDPKDVVFDGRKNRLLESAAPHVPKLPQNTSINKNYNFNLKLPQNLCRLCAQQSDNVTDIFGQRGRLLDLESKLKYFPQVINKHDILPLKICSECVSKVNHFYDFILNCTRAETKLRAMLDPKASSFSHHLTKSDERVDWDSGMETSLNEPPKLMHSPNPATCFPENMLANYNDHVLMDLSGPAEEGYLHGRAGLPKVESSNCGVFEHDYSNTTSRDQFQPETEIRAADEQGRVEETKFSRDVSLKTFRNSKASAHPEKWDLQSDCLSQLCDRGFRCRYRSEHGSRVEEGRCPCKVCDKKYAEIAFLDGHLFAHRLQGDSRPCPSRRESRPKARLKRFIKCHQTEPSFDGGLGQSRLKSERQGCRLREGFSKKQARLSLEKTQAAESHQCAECGKFFRSKASLRQHGSVHSEKRAHNCQECGMSFKRKDTLRNHLRIHTGERPFMCNVCGFAFKQRGDCMKHEKNHGKHGDGGSVPKREFRGQRVSVVGSAVPEQTPRGDSDACSHVGHLKEGHSAFESSRFPGA